MKPITRTALDNLTSEDRQLQNKAYLYLLEETTRPVAWAYDVWDEMIKNLKHKDNHVRAIAAQVLCNLAKSDPNKRMLNDFDALLSVTRDERFVTARHCMQSLWKIGVVGEEQRKKLTEGLTRRFNECTTEKNCTLIRYDILQGLRKLYEEVNDEHIRQRALDLIETEKDLKYRKKYATLWKMNSEDRRKTQPVR
jgi:hypothetical protein